MDRDESPPDTIEAYVRSLSPEGSPQQGPIFERLNRLSGEGLIDYWTVHVVGDTVCPDTAASTQPGQFICNRIQQFTEWADEQEVSFGRYFERRTVSSELTGEEYETMVLPTVTLAEFDEDDSLRFVSPCFDGETQRTPMDRLEQLLAGDAEDRELIA